VRRLVMEAAMQHACRHCFDDLSRNIEPLVTAAGPRAMGGRYDRGGKCANKNRAVYTIGPGEAGRDPAGPSRWRTPRSASNRPSRRLFTVATPNIWTRTQDFKAADLLLDRGRS